MGHWTCSSDTKCSYMTLARGDSKTQISWYSSLQKMMPESPCHKYGMVLVTHFKLKAWGRGEWGVCFPRLGHKGIVDHSVFGSLTRRKASCHIVSTLKQPHEDLHVAKNQGLQSTAIKWVILEADPSPSQAFRRLPTSCLQPWWHPLRQKHPVASG